MLQMEFIYNCFTNTVIIIIFLKPVSPLCIPLGVLVGWLIVVKTMFLSHRLTKRFILFPLTVKEKLTADPESEIATTSLRVSLLCPVNHFSSGLNHGSNIVFLVTEWHKYNTNLCCSTLIQGPS